MRQKTLVRNTTRGLLLLTTPFPIGNIRNGWALGNRDSQLATKYKFTYGETDVEFMVPAVLYDF